MTCTEVRERLPLHAYGDLSADEEAAVVEHLRGCPSCQAEAAALRRVRSALDAAPTPLVRIDVPALFASVAERRLRRWRRFAVATAALAVMLLVVLGLRLRITAGNGQLVIAWGEASREHQQPESQSREQPPVADAPGSPRITELDDRVRLQQELIRALAADIDSRDRQRQSDIDAVRARLDTVQQFDNRRWADAERTMSALYVAQFKRPEEKPNP